MAEGEENKEILKYLKQQAEKNAQPKGQQIQAPTYDGATDVEEFVESFEEIAQHNKWSEEETNLRFKLALKGDAAKGLPTTNYEERKSQLLEKYGIKEKQAHQLLKRIKYRPGEDIYTFTSQLQKVIRIAHPTLSDKDREDIAIKEILGVLPTNHPATWAMTLDPPKNLKEIQNKLKAFDNSSPGVLHIDIATEEVKKEESAIPKAMYESLLKTQLQTQEALQKVTALVNQVTQLPERRKEPRRETRRCWRCHKEGHLARQCSLPPLATQGKREYSAGKDYVQG